MLKFVIVRKENAEFSEAFIRFGNVHRHAQLIKSDEVCLGGGMFVVDEANKKLVLYDKSYDFGYPQFEHLKYFDKRYEGYVIEYSYGFASCSSGEPIENFLKQKLEFIEIEDA